MIRNIKTYIIYFYLLFLTTIAYGQVGIGTSNVSPSARLQVDATDKGFLPPRVTLTGTTDVSTISTPAAGLLVYNTATAGTSPGNVTPGFYYYDGAKWQRIINQQPDATVEFNKPTPTTSGVVFTPNTPASKDYVYVSTVDNSQWTYNGSAYVTYTPPPTTPWMLSGGTTDAGSNKAGAIYRTGSVGIGANTGTNPKATLEITGTPSNTTIPDGILIPRITRAELIAKTAYGASQTGAMIYVTDLSGTTNASTVNVTYIGYYYFDGTVWQRFVNSNSQNISSSVDPNILGYSPSITAKAINAPISYTVPALGGVVSRTATRQAYFTNPVNRHSYAAYTTDGNISWYQAFEAARDMGGYLATFTSDGEWQYAEIYLLNNTAFNTNGAWIGMVKFEWTGAGGALVPDPEMKWITGEQPAHDYAAGGTGAVRKSNWFLSGEPNNSNGNEGFVHVWGKNQNYTRVYDSYTSTHPWNDVTANNTARTASWGFIVEFSQ